MAIKEIATEFLTATRDVKGFHQITFCRKYTVITVSTDQKERNRKESIQRRVI